LRIALTERFVQDVRGLTVDGRAAVFDVILSLPRAMKTPQLHTGIGLRKVHSRGIWELRVGLGLRLVFALEGDTATLVRAGTHDEIKTFLRAL
jgi:mRNA-degrading endonuclease YafQ of YafQ-DinJ toxin-antitoxin module